MSRSLPPELYYLSNFRLALAWVSERYGDLLSPQEQAFIEQFTASPEPSQALLVRMVMRKGVHFRQSKLSYSEIGDTHSAAQPLLEYGWVNDQTPLHAAELTDLLTKDELLAHAPLPERRTSLKKSELREQLLAQEHPEQPFSTWCPNLNDRLYSLQIAELCDRLRLMFFGNLSQDWTEFVLADLGIYRYEQVAISPESRGFQSRQDIDAYISLRNYRLQLEAGEPLSDWLPELLTFDSANPYLRSRHSKLLFQIGQQLERLSELELALSLYQICGYGQARWRLIRVLEALQRFDEAHEYAINFSQQPHDDEESQRLERALSRLQRKLGLPAPRRSRAFKEQRFDLQLPPSDECVEVAVCEHLQQDDAPVYYVENTLICSLFGLLCWDVIFAPLPGAFFHPFHTGPVDLYSPEFYQQRAELFEHSLRCLDSDDYKDLIRQRYQDKFGIQSPFVFWSVLDETLLELALHCIPAEHLAACFQRMLHDLKANRAGMPDLIQFYPNEQRYRMIEVKGPGDRLQDNQKRWLAFAAEHGIDVEVCYVSWTPA
ncbi:VRR-NUC domain-containing protein [Pseudomonas sp. TTU2014-080ASC]|uniref:VRR-NUC domain-containing protein n=1 Tax=Pseudomonas sp. TTU2014-080ASC TaxID=1729724 RepID=UPI0007185A05|nr:VRR-NUC domain-containing protein [Pseudomonas sp. TTU2014-080ASC]KRW59017.1 VRR-NUC domain-containing protein [Pseudomonas sp. TTU2014-080ASC]